MLGSVCAVVAFKALTLARAAFPVNRKMSQKQPKPIGAKICPLFFRKAARHRAKFLQGMQGQCKAVSRDSTGTLCALANEGDGEAVPLIGLGNEFPLASADGWALISRYGDWPHEQGIQRVTRASAEEMVRRFKSIRGRIKRAIIGLPIYNGHPDHAAFANTHTDKTEHGQFSDLEAHDDGFWGKPVISASGAALIEDGKKYLSPHWDARVIGLVNGIRIFEPVVLKSVGLTSNPNIPGLSLANSASLSAMNKTKIIALLAKLGLTVAADSNDEQLNQALDQGTSLANSLAQRPEAAALANEQTARTTAEGKLTAANEKISRLETSLLDATNAGQTALANERKARITLLLDSAQKEGRLTAANRPAWQARLENNFDVESTALANEKPAVKTTPVTAGVGARKTEGEGVPAILSLVNEKAATLTSLPEHARFDAAYKAVKRERPELFAAKKAD